MTLKFPTSFGIRQISNFIPKNITIVVVELSPLRDLSGFLKIYFNERKKEYFPASFNLRTMFLDRLC